MLAVLIVLVLIAASVAGLYLLLKSMGEDGVEAAAPGSCKSGRCGVQPRQTDDTGTARVEVQFIPSEEVRRIDEGTRERG